MPSSVIMEMLLEFVEHFIDFNAVDAEQCLKKVFNFSMRERCVVLEFFETINFLGYLSLLIFLIVG